MSPLSEDPERWLAGFAATAQALQAQAERAQERLAANEVTVENKLVRMTLTSSGGIADLQFKADAGRATAAQLTQSFLEIYRQGAARAALETRDVLMSLAGPDDPSLTAFDRAVPDDVRLAMDEEEERR